VGTTQGGPDAHWEDLGYPTGCNDEYIGILVKDRTADAISDFAGCILALAIRVPAHA